jgi:uncharacterized repeat protein (TIGR01451 family)
MDRIGLSGVKLYNRMVWIRNFSRLVACLFGILLTMVAAPAFAQSDFSDAPSGYGSARHTIVAGNRLGAAIDAEGAAQPSANADGDDNIGSDDEDGVTIGTVQRGAIATITVSVSGAGGFLQGWIDWNGDGDWADAGEQVATNLQDNGTRDFDGAANGQIRVLALVPATASATNAYARFRWSTTSGLSSTANAANGEVEDYRLSIQSEGTTPALGGCVGSSVSTHAITSASTGTTPSITGGPAYVNYASPTNGTITAGAATGNFSTAFSINGFTEVSAVIGTRGIEYRKNSGPNANPDSFTYNHTVTPTGGAGVSQIVVCQAPYENGGGNDEPNELTLTWTGGGSALVYDPNNQISSHANGATISSGTKLIFANSVANAAGAPIAGGGVAGPDSWAVVIDGPGGTSAFTVNATSVGCQLSSPTNFCHLMNTASNTSGDRFNEWFAFDARLFILPTTLTVVKSSVVTTNPVETENYKAIPGATVTYCVLVTNPGPGTASPVSVSDPLPAATTYVPGSLKIGTTCTTGLAAEDDDAVGADEADPVGASISGTTVSATATSLAGGNSLAMVFDAIIN